MLRACDGILNVVLCYVMLCYVVLCVMLCCVLCRVGIHVVVDKELNTDKDCCVELCSALLLSYVPCGASLCCLVMVV